MIAGPARGLGRAAIGVRAAGLAAALDTELRACGALRIARALDAAKGGVALAVAAALVRAASLSTTWLCNEKSVTKQLLLEHAAKYL